MPIVLFGEQLEVTEITSGVVLNVTGENSNCFSLSVLF